MGRKQPNHIILPATQQRLFENVAARDVRTVPDVTWLQRMLHTFEEHHCWVVQYGNHYLVMHEGIGDGDWVDCPARASWHTEEWAIAFIKKEATRGRLMEAKTLAMAIFTEQQNTRGRLYGKWCAEFDTAVANSLPGVQLSRDILSHWAMQTKDLPLSQAVAKFVKHYNEHLAPKKGNRKKS